MADGCVHIAAARALLLYRRELNSLQALVLLKKAHVKPIRFDSVMQEDAQSISEKLRAAGLLVEVEEVADAHPED